MHLSKTRDYMHMFSIDYFHTASKRVQLRRRQHKCCDKAKAHAPNWIEFAASLNVIIGTSAGLLAAVSHVVKEWVVSLPKDNLDDVAIFTGREWCLDEVIIHVRPNHDGYRI